MSLSRPLSEQERWFVTARMNLPTTMELKNERLATEWVDFLTKTCSGFNLRTDDKSWIVTDTPPEIEKLPPNVKTQFGMYCYAQYGLEPDYTKRLGRIAMNGRYVAWNISHSLYDGVSLSYVSSKFQKGEKLPSLPFPDAADFELRDELAKVTRADALRHGEEIATTTKLHWSHPPIKFPVTVRNDSYEVELPYESFPCYNPKTNKFVGLSDVMWRGALLTAHAWDPGQPNWKISTWVNLRPYMKPTTVGNTITPVVIGAEGVQDNWTLKQLEEAVRKNFSAQIKNKAYLRSLRAFDKDIPYPTPVSSYLDVSNSGYYPSGGKIVDMFLVQSTPAAYAILALELGAATNYGGSRDKQYFRLPYSQSVYTRSDAGKIFTALLHSYQKQSGNMTVKEAVRDLQNVIEKTP
jgi:hypothetical protein